MKRKTVLFLILFISIILIAAIPRSVEVINGNYLFGYDQGKHWLAAQSIVVDHKLPLIGDEVGGGQGGFFQGSGWFYLLSIPYMLFRGDPYGAVVLIFLISLGTVALFMALFHLMLGKKEALVGGFLLALSPILIANSRFVWPPFVIPFLTVLYLFCVYRIIQKKYEYSLGMFFIIGLMAHFEIATSGTLFLSTLLWFAYRSMRERIPIKYMALGVLSFFIPLVPLIIFDIRHDFLNSRGIMDMFIGSKNAGITTPEYLKVVSNHWMIFSDEFFRAFQIQYIPKIAMAGFLIAGSVSMLLDKKVTQAKRKFVAFLCILPILLFSVCLMLKINMWAWWISELTVVYVVLCGVILVYGWQKGTIMKVLIIAFVGLMSASYIGNTSNSFKTELSDYGGVHKIQGKKDALDAIFLDADGERFNLLIFTPPIYTYAYDFLSKWYGRTKYGYEPQNEKKGLFYLLMEPDPGEPWRHTGWLETVIKEGTVEKTWTLPSGFVIEKRRVNP